MSEYELIEYRNKLALLARAWRKELKVDGWTPRAILNAWRSSKEFIGGVHCLASKYGQTVTEEIKIRRPEK